jgi:hypothetical protein
VAQTLVAYHKRCHALDHPDPNLVGKAKGMEMVLQEQVGVWDTLNAEHAANALITSKKHLKTSKLRILGTCTWCKASEVKKDLIAHIEKVALKGIAPLPVDLDAINAKPNIIPCPSIGMKDWCCMMQVVSLQKDFTDEKPKIQTDIEAHRHKCLFFPKFHCELNPIENVWGFAKQSEPWASHCISIVCPNHDISRVPCSIGWKISDCM